VKATSVSVHLRMYSGRLRTANNGLHGFVISGQLFLKGLIDLCFGVDKVSQGSLVRIERIRIPVTFLIVWAWLIPPLTSLCTKLVVVAIEIHGFFMGFRAIITQMSNIPANLARHVSFQGLKRLHLSLVLGIIVKFLEEEINLHSEHVSLLEGVHASLTWWRRSSLQPWLDTIFSINVVARSMVSEKKTPPTSAST